MEKDKQEAQSEGIGKQRNAQDVQTYQTRTPLLKSQARGLLSDSPLLGSRSMTVLVTPRSAVARDKVIPFPFSACRVAKQDKQNNTLEKSRKGTHSMNDTQFTALEKQVATLSAKLATLQKQTTGFIARLATRQAVTKPQPKGEFRITSRKAKKGSK